MLEREEYIEQGHFFRSMHQRIAAAVPTQDLLLAVKEEVLVTTNLPLALDFLASELRLHGTFHQAMAKLPHYFTPFQTYVIAEAENDRSRFDLVLAFELLACEAEFRASGAASPQGIFLYEFECLCRNRLGYEKGLIAIGKDSEFSPAWREWIDLVRRQVGLIDLADLIYVHSQFYLDRPPPGAVPGELPVPLFGSREGKIALANRRKDPLFLFAALQRQLGYPEVPRPAHVDESVNLLPQLLRRLERIEMRLKLAEEEAKGGIDLTKFYGSAGRPPLSEE